MIVIYKIFFKHKVNIIYIGSSVNFNERKIRHKHLLKKNIHKNVHLQRLYNKYGVENMVFELIEVLTRRVNLIEKEQFYINKYDPKINILKIAGNALGYRHSEKTKKLLSKINKGRKMTKEQNRKNSIAQMGNNNALGSKRSKEQRIKLSKAKMRKVMDVT